VVRTASRLGVRNPPREAIKKWKRAWKIQLIEADNPQWIDLYYDLKI
jgi:hypothetical protein